MGTLMLAAWVITFSCGQGHAPVPLGMFADREVAMRIASGTFDNLSDETKLHCEINVSEVHGQGKPL